MNDGGPAFSRPFTECVAQSGMSLRDWFAGNERGDSPFATTGEAADFLGIPRREYQAEKDYPRVLAKWRFQCADAMLEAGGHVEAPLESPPKPKGPS